MLEKEEYIIEERTVSIGVANVFALLLMIIVSILSTYIVVNWKINWTKEYFIVNILNIKSIVAVVLMFISIFFHECIHALVFGMFINKKKEYVKIGFDKQKMTPYSYCNGKLRLWQYALAIIAPCLILGFIPYILSIFYKDVIILFVSGINICGAGADVLLILIIVKYGKFNAWVKDHPRKVGFFIIKNHIAIEGERSIERR